MNGGWVPRDGVGDAFRTRVDDPDLEAAVRVHSRADVPGVDGMRRPRCALRTALVGQAASAERRDGRSIVVVDAVDLGVSGESGIDSRSAKKIERE